MTPLEFLREWSEGPWALVAADKDTGFFKGETFKLGQEAAATAWIETHQQYKHNIYFHVNSTRWPVSPKAGRKDIATVDWLHVDIDPRAGEDLAQEQDRILAKLTDNLPDGVPAPTVIIFSGGGYQGFWKLEEPIIIDGDVLKADDAARYNKALEIALGADDCGNADRIMRVPHTINFPDEGKRKKGRVEVQATLVRFEPDRVYAIADFKQAGPAATEAVALDIGEGLSIATASELDALVTRKAKGWAKHLENAKGWLEGKEVKGVRSEPVHGFTCASVRLGISDEMIFGIIQDENWPVSDSVRSHPRGAAGQAQHEVERAHEVVGSLADDEGDTAPAVLHSVTPIPDDLPKRPWLVPDTLLDGNVSMLTGRGGEGKSLTALHFAIMVASGIPFAYWQTKEKRNVLILNAEDDMSETQRRVAAACESMGVDLADLDGKLFSLGYKDMVLVEGSEDDKGKWAIRYTKLAHEIMNLVEEHDIGLVIVDPLVECHKGLDENSNAHMKELIILLRGLARGRAIPILVVHHNRKGAANGDQDAARGGSSAVNACRVVMTMERMTQAEWETFTPEFGKDSFVRISGAKANYSARHGDRWLQFIPVLHANGEETAALKLIIFDNVKDGLDPATWEYKDALLGLVRNGRGDSEYYSTAHKGDGAARLDYKLKSLVTISLNVARKAIAAFETAGLIVRADETNKRRQPVEVWRLAQKGSASGETGDLGMGQ